MAYGKHIAARAEADRLRRLDKEAPENDETERSTASSVPAAPSEVRAESQTRHPGGFRPSGFRPTRTPNQDPPSNTSQPSSYAMLAVEDGIPTVQVVRRLLELAAIEKWSHARVEALERQAHEDPSDVWSQISDAWEALLKRRRAAAIPRDSEQVVFHIVEPNGQRRVSTPTGARAKSMALLQGLDMVRMPVNRSPFSVEQVSMVMHEQRKLRQEAMKSSEGVTTPAPSSTPPTQALSQSTSSPTGQEAAATGRWVRQVRR